MARSHSSTTSSTTRSSSMMHPLSLRLLGPGLEEAFHQDASVSRTYVLFDVMALAQALIVNLRVALTFQITTSSVLTTLLRTNLVVFITLAVAQLLFLRTAPQAYRKHRRAITGANRLLRLTAQLVAVLTCTPESQLARQLAFYEYTEGPAAAAAAAERLGMGGSVARLAATDAASGSPTSHPWYALHNACGSSCRTFAQAFIAVPFLQYAPAHFILSFRHVVLVQLVTFGAGLAVERHRVCTMLLLRPDVLNVARGMCSWLSEGAAAAGRLLAWDPAVLAASSATLCADPLAAMLLLHAWVDAVMLLLVPCAAIYSLERSLKTAFLANRQQAAAAAGQQAAEVAGQQAAAAPDDSLAAAVAAASAERRRAAASAGAGSSSSTTSARADAPPGGSSSPPPCDEELEALLLELGASPEAAAAARPPALSSLAGSAVILVSVVLVLLVLLWYACEAAMVLLLHGGQRRRTLQCDAHGWLTLS